jgi:hypothetical protein
MILRFSWVRQLDAFLHKDRDQKQLRRAQLIAAISSQCGSRLFWLVHSAEKTSRSEDARGFATQMNLNQQVYRQIFE